MGNILDLANVIDVSILGVPSLLGEPNINTAAIFTQSLTPAGWAVGQTFAVYTSASAVIADFGSDSYPAVIATAFFAQQPNPIGTNGYLVVIPLLQSPSLEKINDAIVRTKDSVFYFGVLAEPALSSGDFTALASYMQTVDKVFFYSSTDINDLSPGNRFDNVRTAGQTHVRCLYYNNGVDKDRAAFAGAYAARALSTNFAGFRTVQTMHMKSLANFTAAPFITQTILAEALAAGTDTYPSIAGVAALMTSGGNGFFDEIYNELWFKFALETAGFNYLRATSTKIPQTEAGIEGLKNEYRKICAQAVSNGFLAPGSWTSPDVFGDPATLIKAIEGIGYYVWSQPIAQQSTADRVARKAPLIQIAAKTAGAVHHSSVIVNVNL